MSKERICIRHKLAQTLYLSNPHPSTANRKKTHWIEWKKPQGGFIICDWKARFIQVASFNLRATSVFIAKVPTINNGIKVAVVLAEFTDVHIERDNQILNQAVQAHIQSS